MTSFLNSQNSQKHHYIPKHHNNKRLNQEQVKLLEASFDSTKKLETERKLQLARELGVPPRQISIWYQNRRARWKNQTLEVDYNALQVQLETALSEKRQLEKETERLREELQKANEMLSALNGGQGQREFIPLSDYSISSCCEEGGNSSFQEDVRYTWVYSSETNLQFDELFAVLGSEERSKCSSTWRKEF